MNETEVNQRVWRWLREQKRAVRGAGYFVDEKWIEAGDVPVGDGSIEMDFLAQKKGEVPWWIESKGDVGSTDLLSAVAKCCYAALFNGRGIVAAPSKQIEWLQSQECVQGMVGMHPPGTIGLLNAESETIGVVWLEGKQSITVPS